MLGSPRAQAGLIAVALVATLGAGTASAVRGLGSPPALTAAVADQQALSTPLGNPPNAPVRADTSMPSAPPAPAEQPVAPPTAATPPPPVAPLTTLRKPDLLVTVPAPLTPEQLAALQAIPSLAALTVLDSGPVPVAGTPLRVVGVDPSQFRQFLPQETAASDPLWQSVAGGDVASSYAVAEQNRLPLGGSVPAGGPGSTARIGAIAGFGLPNVDLVASRAVARGLGSVPDTVAVLSAPDVSVDTLRKQVRAVVGDAPVEVLRPAPVAPSTVQGKPRNYRELYIDSARYCPGLRWQVLAAIGQVESGHGANVGPSSAGALGPMQFLPSTWAVYGVDGDGDGKADIMNSFDAVPGAARYLCASGAARGQQGLYDAIFAYNRADWYVRQVLALADQYA